MDQILQSIFSEKGMVYGLFMMTFLLFIYKGLPFLINKIFSLQEAQHKVYKEELEKITSTFIQSITISNQWHQSHSEKLEGIREIVERKYQSRR